MEVRNPGGTGGYLYLDDILLYPDKPPRAKIELEVKIKTSISRRTRVLGAGDSIFTVSGEMEQYRGYVISGLDPVHEWCHLQTALISLGEALAIYRSATCAGFR